VDTGTMLVVATNLTQADNDKQQLSNLRVCMATGPRKCSNQIAGVRS